MHSILIFFAIPFILSLFMVAGHLLRIKNPPKNFASLISLIPLVLLLYRPSAWLHSQIDLVWIPLFSMHFNLKIDILSFIFLLLTCLIVPITIMATSKKLQPFAWLYYGLIFLTQAFLIGLFTAQDLVLFTIFWEGMLIPLFVIIAIWGEEERAKASIRFLIYMISGSALLIAALLLIYFTPSSASQATFDLQDLANVLPDFPHARLLAGIFLLAFCVKTPLFPFHSWLPLAYSQAPLAGTILLAALLSKAGIYGIIRISLGFFPEIMEEWSPLIIGLALFGVLYGALAAWKQTDFKKLIAYSSFSHMNFILVGLFSGDSTGVYGAILQSINHSITITGVFLCAFWLAKRLGNSIIGSASGMAIYLPKLCWITFIFVLSSIGLPSTNNFVGELMILYGLFNRSGWLALILGSSIIFSVVYMLKWIQKSYFETPAPYESKWKDIKWNEILLVTPLIIIIFSIGIYPNPLIKKIEKITPLYRDSKIETST